MQAMKQKAGTAIVLALCLGTTLCSDVEATASIHLILEHSYFTSAMMAVAKAISTPVLQYDIKVFGIFI